MVRRVHKYADGGKVVKPKKYADGGKVEKAKKPNPKMLGSGTAAKAGKALKGRKAKLDKQMEDLGI